MGGVVVCFLTHAVFSLAFLGSHEIENSHGRSLRLLEDLPSLVFLRLNIVIKAVCLAWLWRAEKNIRVCVWGGGICVRACVYVCVYVRACACVSLSDCLCLRLCYYR